MKKEVSPIAVIAAVVLVVGVAAFAYWRSEKSTPPGDPSMSAMPPQVGEELRRRMGGVQPPPNR